MKYFQALLFTLLLSMSSSWAKSLIIETNDILHAHSYLEEGTLFVFDLDNTLIQTAQHLGSDQWFSHQIERFVQQGIKLEDALAELLPRYFEIMKRSEMELVDAAAPDLLSKMQKANVPVMAITRRSPELAERTFEQIAPHNIDFAPTAPVREELSFPGAIYQKGIFFVGDSLEKGEALLTCLKKMNKQPKRVVLIDDKISYIHNVAAVLKNEGIPFVGIRYGGADERVKAFNPKVAEIQCEHLYKILSDEQALQLATRPKN